MKVIQYSTTRCPHCEPAWINLRNIVNDSDMVLILFDKSEIVADKSVGDEEHVKASMSELVKKTGTPGSVPSFVIVEDDFTPITGIIDRGQMEKFVAENYNK